MGYFSLVYNIPDGNTIEDEYRNHEELRRLGLPKTFQDERMVYEFAQQRVKPANWYQIFVFEYDIDIDGEEEIIWKGNLGEFVYKYA